MSAKKLVVLGLTGDIACGKSTVARLLNEKFGAALLDSDLLVRELYGQPAFAARIAAEFGLVLNAMGVVDRAKLGAAVFADAQKLLRLEALVHPAVAALRAQKLADLGQQGVRVVVVEAVKLLESGQGEICDAVWCVVARPEVQIRRLMENRGLSQAEAQQRLQNQPSQADKLRLVKSTPLVWIENNGPLEALEAQVRQQWRQFQAAFLGEGS